MEANAWLKDLYNRLESIEATRTTLNTQFESVLKHLGHCPPDVSKVILHEELTKAGCHVRFVKDFLRRARHEHSTLASRQALVDRTNAARKDQRHSESVVAGIADQIQRAMATLNTGDHAVIVVRKDASQEVEDDASQDFVDRYYNDRRSNNQ